MQGVKRRREKREEGEDFSPRNGHRSVFFDPVFSGLASDQNAGRASPETSCLARERSQKQENWGPFLSFHSHSSYFTELPI